MNYGKSRYWPNTWFTAMDAYLGSEVEPEYNKKYRWFEYYSHRRDYQGDNIVFYFDEAGWKKLIGKKYMVMWMLKGHAQ